VGRESGEGAVPPSPQIFFNFFLQNGEGFHEQRAAFVNERCVAAALNRLNSSRKDTEDLRM